MRKLSTVLALTTLAATTQAQSLDADVVRDPNAGLATYTANVAGASPAASTRSTARSGSCPPTRSEGCSGTSTWTPSRRSSSRSSRRWTPWGRADCSFQLPLTSFEDLTLGFQAVLIDPLSQVAVTNLGSTVQGTAGTGFNVLAWEANHRTDTQQYTLRLFGNPGTQVRVIVNGGDKADVSTNLDGAGQGMRPVPGGAFRRRRLPDRTGRLPRSTPGSTSSRTSRGRSRAGRIPPRSALCVEASPPPADPLRRPRSPPSGSSSARGSCACWDRPTWRRTSAACGRRTPSGPGASRSCASATRTRSGSGWRREETYPARLQELLDERVPRRSAPRREPGCAGDHVAPSSRTSCPMPWTSTSPISCSS